MTQDTTSYQEVDMLSYYQMILEKVSFSSELFLIELDKALRDLPYIEKEALKRWASLHYEELYTIYLNALLIKPIPHHTKTYRRV